MSTCLIILIPRARQPEPLIRWARQAGVDPVVWTATDGEPPLSSFDGLLIAGGSMSPFDPAVPRQTLGRLITRSITRRLPTLAMGSGAHLMAWSLGANPSMPDTPPQLGLRPVNRTAQGRLDPIFRQAPVGARWTEWSELAFTDLPAGSEVLAVDDAGMPQAVRFGPSAWALQGHPFLDRATAEQALAVDAADWPATTRRALSDVLPRLDDVSRSWEALFTAFFDEVARG